MKKIFLILFAFITLLSCKKEESKQALWIKIDSPTQNVIKGSIMFENGYKEVVLTDKQTYVIEIPETANQKKAIEFNLVGNDPFSVRYKIIKPIESQYEYKTTYNDTIIKKDLIW